MNHRITNLAASRFPAPSDEFEGLIHLPHQLSCPTGIIFQGLERAVRQHLLFQTMEDRIEQAERILVVQGDPGTGKTVSTADACKRAGYAVALLPSSRLASESEGGATEVLDRLLAAVVASSEQHRMPHVIVADDIDCSIITTDAKTGRTVNSDLLTQRLQHLADTKRPRNFDGTGLALIFTGNDFSQMRASLLRDGRATIYTHVPTLDEKIEIAFATFQPQGSGERRLIEKLVRRYRHQPVAFLRSLRNDLDRQRLDELLATRFPTASEAQSRLTAPLQLDATRLWSLAKARTGNRARNFL